MLVLEEYKDIQPNAYRILSNAIQKNKYSHAYLFETKDDGLLFAKVVAKKVLCPKKNGDCEPNCSICQRIDDGNYTELLVIEPEGIQIKKESIINMQKAFSKKPVEGKVLVYVIKDCDKLNKASANTILKFLEEPDDNIVALLLTSDVDKVLKTIVSRCQVIRLISDENIVLDARFNSLESKDFEEKKGKVIEVIRKYEEKGFMSAVEFSKLGNEFNKKDELNLLFEIILWLYKDALNYKANRGKKYFSKNVDVVTEIARHNEINSIARKIDVILETKNKLGSNLNSNLLFDKFLIGMDGEIDA